MERYDRDINGATRLTQARGIQSRAVVVHHHRLVDDLVFAIAVHVANSVVDVLESEGLAAGLDFYGARGHSVFGVAMSDDDEPSADGGSDEEEEVRTA